MTSINAAAAPAAPTGQAAMATSPASDPAAFQAVLAQQVGTKDQSGAQPIATNAVAPPDAATPALAQWLEALAKGLPMIATTVAATTTNAKTGEAQANKSVGETAGTDVDASAASDAANVAATWATLPLNIVPLAEPDPKLGLSTGVAESGAQESQQVSPIAQPLAGATNATQIFGGIQQHLIPTLDSVLRGAGMQPVATLFNSIKTETSDKAETVKTADQPAGAIAANAATGVSLGKTEAAEPYAIPTPLAVVVPTSTLASSTALTGDPAIHAGRAMAATTTPGQVEDSGTSKSEGQERPAAVLQVAGGNQPLSAEHAAARTLRVSAGAAVNETGERHMQQPQSNMQAQTVVSSTTASDTTGAAEATLSLSETQRAAVVSQISDAVLRAAARRPSEVRIRLDPPELGSLNIKIISHRGGLEIQLGAASESVRSMLESHITSLRASFTEQGLSQANFQVFVGGQNQPFDQGRADQRAAAQQAAQQTREERAMDSDSLESSATVLAARADGLDYRA